MFIMVNISRKEKGTRPHQPGAPGGVAADDVAVLQPAVPAPNAALQMLTWRFQTELGMGALFGRLQRENPLLLHFGASNADLHAFV